LTTTIIIHLVAERNCLAGRLHDETPSREFGVNLVNSPAPALTPERKRGEVIIRLTNQAKGTEYGGRWQHG
jgi:hypothetical protein